MSGKDRISTRRATALLAGALALGVVTGGGALGFGHLTQSKQPVSSIDESAPATSEAGPELIPGRTDDGKAGFIRVEDLARSAPAGQAGRSDDEESVVVLTVYAEDGRTRIGTHTAPVVRSP